MDAPLATYVAVLATLGLVVLAIRHRDLVAAAYELVWLVAWAGLIVLLDAVLRWTATPPDDEASPDAR